MSISFIKSRAQHRQAGAIPFYSYCVWISEGRGAVVTYDEVSINKLRSLKAGLHDETPSLQQGDAVA